MAWGEVVVLLLLLALGPTWGSPWCCSAASTGERTFTLPSNCPTSCGNISIQYPFGIGIGNGCYLPGFNLTCLEQYTRNGSAKLFMGDGTLEYTRIDLPSAYVYIKLPVVKMDVNHSSIAAPLIDLRNYHNFNFWGTNKSLFVSGCNVNAGLVDLANNNTIISNCSTICLDVGPDLLNRLKECKIEIGKGLRDRVFLGVHLTRHDQIQWPLANATEVRAYMSSSIGSLEA